MARFDTKKALRAVQNKWGKEDESQSIDFHFMENNFAHMMKKEDWILDDQTWNDLDLNQGFIRMNRTFTNPGQQMLYNMLRILRFDEEELKRRDRMITFLQMNKEKREQIQTRLHYVSKEEFDSAASLCFKKVPELPKMRAWVIPATLGMIASLVSIPFLGMRSLFLIIIFFILNIIIHNSFNKYTDQALPGLRYIARMLCAAQAIADLKIPELDDYYNDFFEKAVEKCRPILRKSRALGNNSGFEDPLGLGTYLQILFLSEARAYLRCSMYLEKLAPVLRTLYRRLGELDAFQSMASVRRGMRQFTRPSFTEEQNILNAVKLGHPMLKGAVCNDVTIQQKNMVITGSNMSGKSTFLRTLGINQVLAQTFYTVMAKKYECSWFNVVTSISPSDDMAEGKSYYMAEATALLRMVNIVSEDRCSLLLVDEIFRGTNPLERVAGASSLLEYLAKRNALVVVATHDAEIVENIQDQYDQYHFEEKVTKDSLEFDYLLKEGPLLKPNGIHILEYLGYPEEIVETSLEKVRGRLSDQEESPLEL